MFVLPYKCFEIVLLVLFLQKQLNPILHGLFDGR